MKRWLGRLRPRPMEICSSPAAKEVMTSEDTLQQIFRTLAPKDLQACAQVCTVFRRAATHDLLWRPLCEDLWKDKKLVPERERTELPAREAYCLSLEHSRNTEISTEELCSFPWAFRFKRSAGEYWTSIDPYWTGQGPLLRRVFKEDGNYQALQPDPFWIEEGSFRWRFTKSCQGSPGHFVKVNNYPSLTISRTEDWRFRMENMWVVMVGPADEDRFSKKCMS